jgi:hypothetical protein
MADRRALTHSSRRFAIVFSSPAAPERATMSADRRRRSGSTAAAAVPMHKILRRRSPTAVALVAILIAAACGKNNSDPSVSTTTPTPTPVAPTTTDEFDATVPVGGSAFYAFSVSQYGTVNITLTSVSGADVPPTVMLGLGIGTPSGTACATTGTTDAAAGSTAQLTGAYDVGVYCAKVSDIGNLFAPASFTLTISHP